MFVSECKNSAKEFIASTFQALQSADPHLDSDIIFVKYLKARPSSLSLWRLRDEAFRLNNRSQMGGWLWVSSTLVRRFQKPEPVPLNIDYLNPSNNVRISNSKTYSISYLEEISVNQQGSSIG